MRFTTSQTSFKSGRLSPKLFSRIDTKQYRDGMSICQGFRVLPEGGAEKIKGSRWINSAAFNSNINFDSSNSISFQINGKQMVLTITINTFNEVSGYLYTYPYVYGTEVVISLVSAGPNIYPPSGFSWALVDNKIFMCHSSGNLSPRILNFSKEGVYENLSSLNVNNVSNPYGLPQGELRSTTLTISNEDTVNKTIDITSTDADSVTELQSSRFVYLEALCARVNEGDNNRYRFIGSGYYRIQSSITNGVRVRYFAGFTPALFNFPPEAIPPVEALIASGVTEVDIWSTNEWGQGDYPKHVSSHEGRVVYGGSRSKPLSIFGSKVSEPFFLNNRRIADTGSTIYTSGWGYTGEIVTTDPYLFTISADEDSEITNMAVTTDLFIGTDRKEYIATGGDSIMSALSVQIKPYTTQGSYPSLTTTMENAVVYTDSTRKKVYAFKYNEANGSFVSQELSILFGDLMEDDFVKELEWVPHIKSLYVLTNKGNLYGITNDMQNDTVAFYDTLERGIQSLVYIAAREDVATSTSIHRGDHVYLYKNSGVFAYEQVFFEKGVAESHVKIARTMENEYLYLEKVFDIVRLGNSQYSINGQIFATGSDLYPVPTNSPLFGADIRALNLDTGEAVSIEGLIPDAGNPWFLIDNEKINGASRIVLGSISDVPKILATMPVEAGQQWGSAQMGIKNIDELGIRHYKSYSYDISSDGENWQEVRVADKLGNCTIGRETTRFSSNYKYDQIVFIRSTKPEPLTITGINMRGVSNDG